jgi:hypothetical protein
LKSEADKLLGTIHGLIPAISVNQIDLCSAAAFAKSYSKEFFPMLRK